NELRSPREGTVHGLRVAAGDKVEQGEILAVVK
ncbi:MAG: acetyl-CoA carboxylase biotin carboxyl carrier protein subunit, partial [Chloroflexi bacterium]|nr:acetyl-CoA carboxylase biotin carboxyl carrier protein subunit [Chloroflexota bacterium]